MMGDGMSTILGVIVILLMLTMAILFILNRKAVAVRGELQQHTVSLFDPAYRPQTADVDAFWSPDPVTAGWGQETETAQAEALTETLTLAPPAEVGPQWEPAVTEASASADIPVSLVDPVPAVVDALLEGTGELGPSELRRLELYRPERIIEYAALAEGAIGGRDKETKRARLSRVRRYAESLVAEDSGLEQGRDAAEIEDDPVAQEPVADDPVETDDEQAPAGSSWAPEPAMEWTPSPAVELESAAPAPETTDETPTSEALVEPGWREAPLSPLDPELSLLIDEPEAEIVNFPLRADVVAGAETPGEPAESIDRFESSAAFGPFEAEAPRVDVSWPDTLDEWPVELDNRQTGTWEPGVEPSLELAAELGHDEAPIVEEQATPEEAPMAEEHPLQQEAVLWDSPPAETEVATSAAPGVELNDLSAEELLSRYAAAAEPDVKRAIIDRLSANGSPEALDGLQTCFEDEDPMVQLYALEAAERVLSHC